MFTSSISLFSCIKTEWLALPAVLFLTLLTGSQRILAATTGPAPPINHSQFIEPGQIPQSLSAADWDGIQQAYLKASNTETDDAFGLSVAVSGSTAVVGAFQEDSNAIGVNNNQDNNSAANSGAAYIFVRSNGVWSQQAYLKASNTGANDQFGRSVAISGETVVVGAQFEDSNATGINGADNQSALDSGAAYVFVRSGTIWSQQAYLKASNTGAGDQFGWSVAVSGDTVVVGAYLEDSSATGINGDEANNLADNSGAAYVFTRSGGTWSQQAYLKASNTDDGDRFGFSLAVSGNTAVVGATEEMSKATGVNGNQDDDSLTSAGAAYIFVRSGTSWSQQAYLKASNTDMSDVFGHSVAVSGDIVVVGAPEEDSSTTGVNNGGQGDNSAGEAGAAYIFTRSSVTWSQQAYLKASNTGAGDKFGYSVTVSGDTVVVGAPDEDSSTTVINGDQGDNSFSGAGAAYVFTRAAGVWSQQAYLKASNTGAGDQFGRSAAVSGDTVLVGAFLEDSDTTGVNSTSNESATDSGAAYLFRESFCSNQSGNWGSPTTWVGGVPPGSGDDACIGIGDKVTLVGATAVNSLVIYPDAALDLANFGLTAANGVTNHGTLSQTLPVDGSTSVEFLHIQDGSANTQYRGLIIGSSQNLGNVEVGVRETVNWHTVTNGDGLDTNQYCTNTGSSSPAYAQRCYTITPTNQPAANVTLRLWGLSSELNGIAENNLRVYRNIPAGSSTWVELANPSTGSDGVYSFAQADTPGFSDFLLGQSGNAPTAILLTGQEASGPDSRLVWVILTAALLLGLVSFLLIRRQAA